MNPKNVFSWNWFIANNYFDLVKIFSVWVFKMVEFYRLVKRSSGNLGWLRSAKQVEFFRRTCDVYGESYFSQNCLSRG